MRVRTMRFGDANSRPERLRAVAGTVAVGSLLLGAAHVLAACWHYYGAAERVGRHRVETAWLLFCALALFAVALRSPKAELPPERVDAATPLLGTHRFVPFLAVICSFALYWPALSIGMLSDDFVFEAWTATQIADPSGWQFFRPLPLLVWKLAAGLGAAPALHATNIVLHAVNAYLLGRLVLRMGHTRAIGLFATAAFLFFPAATEPVAWSSGIFDILLVLLGLAYIHMSVAAGERRPAIGLALLAAALLSKETAVVLPLLLWCLTPSLRVPARVLYRSVLLVAFYGLLRLSGGSTAALGTLRGEASFRYTAKELLVRPFATLGAPWTAAELDAQPVALGMLPVALILALVVAYAWRPRLGLSPAAAAAWVPISVVPLFSLFFVGGDLQGSRYVYLPLCGWIILLAELLGGVKVSPRLIVAGLLPLVALAGAWSVREHLVPWQQAAAVRDRLLREARVAHLEGRCARSRFRDVPEVYQGAYVFRNGWEQAVTPTLPPAAGERACEFAWEDFGFRRVSE